MRVYNDIMILLDNGNSLLLVFLDLLVVFDIVNYDLFFFRFEKCLGIIGIVFNWFKFYFCSFM